MADKYRDFAHLAAHEHEGEDFTISACVRDPRRLVLAPHGGGIERGSGELARAIAAAEHSLYVFEGLKRNGNSALHVTSTHFDEPRLLTMLAQAEHVLAVHGASSGRSVVYVGGLDEPGAERMRSALGLAGFTAEPHAILAGRDPCNICNRGRTHAGVQIEIAMGLRRQLFEAVSEVGVRRPTPRFGALVVAIRSSFG